MSANGLGPRRWRRRSVPSASGRRASQARWYPPTPLIATITVIDIYSVAGRVRRDLFITYEPLLLLAVVYLLITAVIVLLFRQLEKRVPTRVS